MSTNEQPAFRCFMSFCVSWSAASVCLSSCVLQSFQSSSSVFLTLSSLDIYFSFFSVSQLWKGLEVTLMQFCMSAAYLNYLFSQVLLSPSYAVTEVGLFIMTRLWSWAVFRLFFVFCPRFILVRLSRPPQRRCTLVSFRLAAAWGRAHTLHPALLNLKQLSRFPSQPAVTFAAFLSVWSPELQLWGNPRRSVELVDMSQVNVVRRRVFHCGLPLLFSKRENVWQRKMFSRNSINASTNIFSVNKMSRKREKCLVLLDRQSKSQIRSVLYCQMWQREAADPQIWGAGTCKRSVPLPEKCLNDY